MKQLPDWKMKLAQKTTKPRATLRVCMMGPRGVGKTSVLTAMFRSMNESTMDTSLQITAADAATTQLLDARYLELTEMFRSRSVGGRGLGIAASFETNLFNFQFDLKGKQAPIDLEVKDFPGEFVSTRRDEVLGFLRESNAIIVALDTPHLMEYEGYFHEDKNCSSLITGFFKEEFSSLEDDRLVLLVPLKCEKYYHENRMEEVAEAVLDGYAELINFLSSPLVRDKVALVITPILTVGGIAFTGFDTDESGAVKILSTGVPAEVTYDFLHKQSTYSPLFCEQPLRYLVSFITKQYQKSKQSEIGFLRLLQDIFGQFFREPLLVKEMHAFSRHKLKDQDGFRVLIGEEKV